MKKNRKIFWWCCIISPLAITFLIWLVIGFLQANFGPIVRNETKSFDSIPGLEKLFEGLPAIGVIQYTVVDKYRYAEYHVAGTTTQEAFKKWGHHHPAWLFYTESYDLPPDSIAEVMKELDPEAIKDWSSDSWFVFGNEGNSIQFTLGFNAESGKLWCEVYRQHAENPDHY